jgi:hypothetical protein
MNEERKMSRKALLGLVGLVLSAPAYANPITLTMSGSAQMAEVINPGTAFPTINNATGSFTFTFTGDNSNFSNATATITPLSTHLTTHATVPGGVSFDTDLQTGSSTVTDIVGFPAAIEFQINNFFAISGESTSLAGFRFDKSLGPISLGNIGVNNFVVLPPFDGNDILNIVRGTITNVTFTSSVGGTVTGVPEPTTFGILGLGILGLGIIRTVRR